MRKIVLILDGIVAKSFLESLITTYPGTNTYEVVCINQALVPEIVPENFRFHIFDPTSYSKLSNIINNDISEIFIILAKKDEIIATYKNVREINKTIKICLLDEIDLEADDVNLIRIKPQKIIANRLIQKLPNIPVTAQNIGLGIGEIMEISIPFGSTYSYRFIGSIEQKNWKIVAIYRESKLLIADDHMAIMPNDNILVIGEPSVLATVYKSIKKELGLFPLPFGGTLYFYFDMLIDKKDEIKSAIENALYLKKRLKNRKLFIRIANPTDIDFLNELKKLDIRGVYIYIDYQKRSFKKILQNDTKQFGSGLIAISRKLFKEQKKREVLYDINLPVLKLGQEKLEEISEILLFLGSTERLESISSIIFDIASQLDLKIFIYDEIIDNIKNQETIKHYEELARIYSKNVNIIKNPHANPILSASKRELFLHILPFSKEIIKRQIFWFFSTNVDRLYFKLDRFNQLFIPIGA